MTFVDDDARHRPPNIPQDDFIVAASAPGRTKD